MYAWNDGLGNKTAIPVKDMIIKNGKVYGHGHIIFNPKTASECELFIARWRAKDTLLISKPSQRLKTGFRLGASRDATYSLG